MEPMVDLVVVGAGPGGYAAAFAAADHGLSVVLIEEGRLGGVCLNRGCIPSKALLHAAGVISEAKAASDMGITFGEPKVDLEKLVHWKDEVVQKLSSGVQSLAQKRGVKVIIGRGYFESSTQLRVETESGQQFFEFKKAILAVGSRPALPAAFDLGNPRIMTSTEALELADIPEKLLVVGGGYIGLELGTVYAKLGSEVVVVEAAPRILSGIDSDLARPVQKSVEKIFKEIRVNTKVKKMVTKGKQIGVQFEGVDGEEMFDRVLVSIGRVPNGKNIGLENTKVTLDDRGFVVVQPDQTTSDSNILAIGDIAGGVMLAHKASKEARVAVDTIVGITSTTNVIIPAVVFTDPEVAWVGLTEDEAKAKGIAIEVGRFPWGASGRALTLDRADGLTKIIADPVSHRILGVGIAGVHAGDLIAEAVLAIEMGATVDDLAAVVHPHPTLSESLMEAAEVFLGHSTHVYAPKKRDSVGA